MLKVALWEVGSAGGENSPSILQMVLWLHIKCPVENIILRFLKCSVLNYLPGNENEASGKLCSLTHISIV